ncbi:MAG TPA: nucleoside-diphosphate sugar epimerase/dehydratase [Thermoanaerobaculia bacterium]|nr:nucleoside-diphosphate sugar epimerase/dehydratase [Thermoanaerobaculia bacterium]
MQQLRKFDLIVERMAPARVAILVLFHTFIFAACYAFATLTRFDFQLGEAGYSQLFKSALPVVVTVELLFGTLFGFHRGWWRYVGMSDVLKTVLGTTCALAFLLASWYIDPSYTGISRGVLLINWAFVNVSLFGARAVIRIFQDFARQGRRTGSQTRVLIIGAGDAGEALAREIQHRPQLGMKVVGFVDDKAAKWNSQIRGIGICGPISEIAGIAERLRASEALIAIPSAPGKRIREILHHVAGAALACKTIPGMDQLVTGKVQVTQLRPVNLEDLVRREKIELPGDPVRQLFEGKRVLVTGAGGTIGAELAAQVLDFAPARVFLLERSEYALYECDKRLSRERTDAHSRVSRHLVDIRDANALESLMASTTPHIVLHAAAHKHVPLGEENAMEYVRNNTLATRKLAEACERHGVERFVFISTDKAINPTSVMGASKRAAEIALLDLTPYSEMKITAVRFGNVLGSSGSVVPLFLEQIAAGGPVTVTHPEVTRYFLRTSEAISLVLQAATLGEGGRVFMLDMGEPVRIAELARDLIELSNHTVEEIPIVFTGLRPGEKLFEEIRLAGESIHSTVHPQIVITEAPQPSPEAIRKWLADAEKAEYSAREAIAALKELVPEYTPESEQPHSRYQDQPPTGRPEKLRLVIS